MIFGENYTEYEIVKTLKSAKIRDLHKVQTKVFGLEDGDTIKVAIIPELDNEYIDTFKFCNTNIQHIAERKLLR